MELVADGLLIATAVTAGLYCMVLSRRLRDLTDSGGGIGLQIEALNHALAETRAALAETRGGVSEARGAAKASLSELSLQCAAASELAGKLSDTVRRAETTMQRLYQVEERIEAHDAWLARAGGSASEQVDPAEDAGHHTDAAKPGTNRSAPQVELHPQPKTGRDGARAARPGNSSVLKAERMML